MKKISFPKLSAIQLILLIIFIALLVIAIYLNRVYANFFNRIGELNLKSPFQSSQIMIWNDNTQKITNLLFIGDSLTSGVGSNDYTKTYPYLIAEKLATDSSVILTIKATPGAELNDLTAEDFTLPTDYSADKTFLLIGINDLFARTNLADFEQKLMTLSSKLKQQKTEVYFLTIPLLAPNDAVPFPYNFLYEKELQKYNSVIKNVAIAKGIKVLDLYNLTKTYQNDENYYASDRFHPNEKGYIIWADQLLTEL